jgi:hypothetical protein
MDHAVAIALEVVTVLVSELGIAPAASLLHRKPELGERVRVHRVL